MSKIRPTLDYAAAPKQTVSRFWSVGRRLVAGTLRNSGRRPGVERSINVHVMPRPGCTRNDNVIWILVPSHPREETGNDAKRWVSLRRKRAAQSPHRSDLHVCIRLLIRRFGVRSPGAEGHRNSDHARDLPIHESVPERTKHGRRGLSMPETSQRPVFDSQALKSWIASLAADPMQNQSDREPGVFVHNGQKERIPGQRHDLNKCTLQGSAVRIRL